MTPSRSNFASEFLLRELLSALGTCVTSTDAITTHADSFSESLGENTESQSISLVSQSRVMLVRRSNSSQQIVTLVDREYDIEAYIPSHVIHHLQQKQGYQTLGRLRGSVVRVTKYHFATMARCLATEQSNRVMPMCVKNATNNKAPVYLYVDALAIVEDNELAVKPLPLVYTHPLVIKRLQAMSDAELEKQLMIHQGLPPVQSTVRDTFDDDRPLLEEDCVISKEQEQELDEQDEWGPSTTIERQITDSELIEENGSVPMSDSQLVREHASPEKSIVSIDSSMTSSESSSVAVSDQFNGTTSPKTESYQFQQENIQETFVAGSDLESSDTEDEMELQKEKKSKLTPFKTLENSNKLDVAHCSPTSASPKKPPRSGVIIDVNDDPPEKTTMATPPSSTETALEHESKSEAGESQIQEGGNASLRLVSRTPPKGDHPTEQQAASAGWATSLLRMVGLGAALADTSSSHAQSSCEKTDDIDQSFNQAEHEEEETKFAQPESVFSSQATVILHYDADSDDGAHAFEYDGVLSDDPVSPQLKTHNQERSLVTKEARAEDLGKFTLTPQKMQATTEDTISLSDTQTPSPSAPAVTPRTDNSNGSANLHSPTNLTRSEKYDASLSMESMPKVASLPIPSRLTISVGSSGNRGSRTGFAVAKSQACKRSYQVTKSGNSLLPSLCTQQVSSMSHPRIRKDDQCRLHRHKRCRRNIIANHDQSPQFEHQATPFVPRRPLLSDQRSIVSPSFSLEALCSSLGSCQDNDEDQARILRQPCRAWKRYEHLFPPLDMTHMKHLMAKSHENDT